MLLCKKLTKDTTRFFAVWLLTMDQSYNDDQAIATPASAAQRFSPNPGEYQRRVVGLNFNERFSNQNQWSRCLRFTV